MSSGFLDRARHGFSPSLGLRISGWYACSFLAGFLLIAFFTLWIVKDSDLRLDRVDILQEFAENANRCREVGSATFVAELRRAASDIEMTLVRISTPGGGTAFLSPAFGESQTGTQRIGQELQAARVPGWSRLPAPGENGFWQVYAERMPDGYWVQVAMRDRRVQELRARFRAILLPLGLFTIALALAGAAILTTRALRPVRQLIDTTRTVIESGDMTARVPVRTQGGHELDELKQLFNRMLVKNEGLIRGMREALDNVAHDLRTPLTRMRVSAEDALLAAEGGPGPAHEALADAIEESDRALAMLRTLMDISEAEYGTMHLSPERLNVAAMLQAVVELYHHVAEESGVRLRLQVQEGLQVMADPMRLQQVLCNLLENAIKYSRPGGEVTLEAQREKEHLIGFTVRDRGIGISAQDLPRVWDRLYRADPSRSQRGLGLGLSLVKAIVQAHGGRTEVESVVGEGSVFRIFLPADPS